MASPESARGSAVIDDVDTIANEERQEEHKKKIFDSLVQRAVSQYRRALGTTKSITERDVSEFEEYNYSDSKWNELNARTYDRRIEMISDSINTFIPALMREVIDDETSFFREVQRAKEKGWIDDGSVRWWESQLKSKKWTHFQKQELMNGKFRKQLENCRLVAEERADLVDEAKKNNMTTKQIPELATILDSSKFLSLTYPERKNTVHKVKALILGRIKKKEKLARSVEKDLTHWAKKRWMHKAKIGKWMRHVMESDNPDVFVSEVLLPYKNRWQGASEKFDELHEDMQKNEIPRGLRMLSKDAFLMLDYEQRMSYLREVELRMNGNEKEETDPRLDAFKKKVRHNLDTQDWEGAEEVLGEARDVYPEDADLKSMANFLRLHRPSADVIRMPLNQEKPDPRQTIAEMRTIVSQLPQDLQWLYAEAMKDGPAVFNRLLQLVYNRVWVYEHHYGNEQLDREHAESEYNKEKTKDYIENGHSRQFERNILDGETAHDAAIRDECTKPQVLYMGDMGRESVLRKVRVNADNEKFGYWTTLVPTDVPYAIHRMIVKNYNYKLKSGLRQLDKQGYRFTMHGAPESKTSDDSAQPATQTAAAGTQRKAA